MAYNPTEWKDRVVERPRTYTIQNNPDGTVTLIPAPGEIYEEGTHVNAINLNKIEQGIAAGAVQADLDAHKAEKATDEVLAHVMSDGGDTTQIDENGVMSVPDGRFMNAAKVRGNVSYTNTIAAKGTLTRTIALGGEYRHGMATIARSHATDIGIMVFFGTNNLDTLVVGYRDTGSAGAAWSRRDKGFVSSPDYSPGVAGSSGRTVLHVREIYINGTNLEIQFYNTYDGAEDLYCTVDWEVW